MCLGKLVSGWVSIQLTKVFRAGVSNLSPQWAALTKKKKNGRELFMLWEYEQLKDLKEFTLKVSIQGDILTQRKKINVTSSE